MLKVDGGKGGGPECVFADRLKTTGALADFFGADDAVSRTNSYFREYKRSVLGQGKSPRHADEFCEHEGGPE